MNARSALFDLYGDHLVRREGKAPVATLIRCLGSLDIAAPAVRTAVSRMVSQDWLVPIRLPAGPGYALTPRGADRMVAAADRIYRRTDPGWDTRWHVVILERMRDRSRRERVRAGLGYLGYGALDDTTWVAARRSGELDALLDQESVTAEQFSAEHSGDTTAMVARIWDLPALANRYESWLADAAAITASDGAISMDEAGTEEAGSEEAAFVARSRLVHEWRKFLFVDPGLPSELLPADWAGDRAARYFDSEAARLRPAASRFVDDCLALNERRPT